MEITDLLRHAERVAVVTEDGASLTYACLDAAVAELCARLESHTLGFILCRNTPGALIGYLASLRVAAPALLIDASKGRDVIDGLRAVYSPRYIWAPAEIAETLEGHKAASAFGYTLVLTGATPVSLHPDLALLLTTSGSTGSPKLVRLTGRNLESNASSIALYLGLSADERAVTSLPMHYSYGLSVINSHLLCGASLLMTERPVIQREFWDFVKREHATSLAGVPYTYEMLRRLRIFRMDLPHLRTLTQAGGKLRPELVKEFVEGARASGKRFMVMYGQTEATARMSYIPEEHALEKCASIGVPIPGGRLSIADGADEGELIYEGPNVSMGYAESSADLARGDDNNGILHTGDLARMDADGYFYITGRMKRFVKIWGNRCNLDSLEQIVKTVTPDCACVGIDDLVTIFLTDASLETPVKTLLCAKTGLNVRAFAVRIVSELPISAAGKVSYATLQSMTEQ